MLGEPALTQVGLGPGMSQASSPSEPQFSPSIKWAFSVAALLYMGVRMKSEEPQEGRGPSQSKG